MASFTRKAIMDSFIKLLNERPLNQITVKDIVEDCGVNRNSFYYHFADIPTLLNQIVTEHADRIIEEHASASSLEECVAAMVEFSLENKRAALHIFRSANRDLLERHLLYICQHMVTAYAQAVFGQVDISESDKEILSRFYKCQCFGQTIEWLTSGMSYDIVAQFHRLGELRVADPAEIINRCTREN